MQEFKVKKLGVMLDCSRDAVYSVAALKEYIDTLASMGYNVLQLYTEDVYTIDEPYFGYLRGKYTEAELKELDDYAYSKGVELVPCIQALAHLSGFLRWKDNLVDCADILLAGSDEVYELIDKMFAALARCYRTRRIHLGMDEAHMVGLGKYLDKHGYTPRNQIIIEHLEKVLAIGEKYGFKGMIWSDMFFRLNNNGAYYLDDPVLPQEVIDSTPKNVDLVYWDYYSLEKSRYDAMFKAHKRFGNRIVFAGGAWSWSGFIPQNYYSVAANEAAIRSCIEQGVDDILLTVWGDDGAECSLNASYPSLFFAAEMARGEFDRTKIIEKFNKAFEIPFEQFMRLDAPDRLDEGVEHPNPCKYMLYSDPFLGIYDYTVDVSKAKHYEDLEKELLSYAKGKYGYVFETISALCGVMKYKYPLGIQTREAYQTGDKEGLKALVENYEKLEKNIEYFHEKFRVQWNKEAKPYGFEKHDVRLGGLACRVKSCKRRILAYLNGEVEKIDELEENILPVPHGNGKGVSASANGWINIALIKPTM